MTIGDSLKLDAHTGDICRKIGGQVNALNRPKEYLRCKAKEALYRAFILPHSYFFYCSQVRLHFEARNTSKLARESKTCTICTDNITCYHNLLKWIGQDGNLEAHRV